MKEPEIIKDNINNDENKLLNEVPQSKEEEILLQRNDEIENEDRYLPSEENKPENKQIIN